MAQWLGPMNQAPSGSSSAQLAQSAQSLAAAFADPNSPETQALVAAVQTQSPLSTPASIQGTASQTLAQVAAFYAQQPADQAVPGVSSIQSALRGLGLPVPRADLATLPSETVASAVAWLGARGLPPQRPLVESVAGWMNDEQNVLPGAQKALASQENLPPELLESRPALKAAYADLATALQASGLNPDGDLATQLQQWAGAQGFSLESQFAEIGSGPSAAGLGSAPSASAPQSAPTLRGALLQLEDALHSAAQAPATASPSAAAGLDSALKETQAAVRGFNALPLQAQSAPAFDTVHLPIPVWMNGALGDGRLSVTWRQGRERTLNDKEPVSVAVSLNTESLGTVKVHLQVWKDAASARVTAQDKATADFLAQGSDELKSGFAERTPFKLQSVEFAAETASAPSQAPGVEGPSAGIQLSA